jgi:hypothetical protein
VRHAERHRIRFRREVELAWESCDHGVIYPGWKHHDGGDVTSAFFACVTASWYRFEYFRSALCRAEEVPEVVERVVVE